MMKKLLVLLLSAMMVMSLVACGGDDTETDGADQQVENEADVDVTDEEVADDTTDEEVEMPYLAFGVDDPSQLEHMEMPEIGGTTWALCGGFNDNVEFTEEVLANSLEAYGGVCNFVFNEDGTAQLVQGGGALDGTYEYVTNEDGTCVAALVTFTYDGSELRYACYYTEVEGVSVMIGIGESLVDGMYLYYAE